MRQGRVVVVEIGDHDKPVVVTDRGPNVRPEDWNEPETPEGIRDGGEPQNSHDVREEDRLPEATSEHRPSERNV